MELTNKLKKWRKIQKKTMLSSIKEDNKLGVTFVALGEETEKEKEKQPGDDGKMKDMSEIPSIQESLHSLHKNLEIKGIFYKDDDNIN